MGLDSVELAITLENKLGFIIPDEEWAQTSTIQDISNVFLKRLTIEPNNQCISQRLFYKIRTALRELKIIPLDYEINRNTYIVDILSTNLTATNWNKLEKKLMLKLPELVKMDFNKELDTHIRILGFKTIKRKKPVTKGTIEQLIGWIISLNYEKLIQLNKISNKYELERVVSGIVSENIGLPINEIEMYHSITNDLGVD